MRKVQTQTKTLYSSITLAAWHGLISAEHLYDPPKRPNRGSTSGIWTLEKALENLAEGGYVIDLRPLADHPDLISWVMKAPLLNGRIEGDDIDRLSAETRKSAREMAPFMGGAFQDAALLMTINYGDKEEEARSFDAVSSAYLAVYWRRRGALIGKRCGNTLYWSDLRIEQISDPAAA